MSFLQISTFSISSRSLDPSYIVARLCGFPLSYRWEGWFECRWWLKSTELKVEAKFSILEFELGAWTGQLEARVTIGGSKTLRIREDETDRCGMVENRN